MDRKRNTIQRQLIFNAVKELDVHATVEQVYECAAKAHPTLSKATVYRNLSRMEEAGALQNVGIFMGAAHYDHNFFRHYHFICEACGNIFDVLKIFPEIDEPLEGMEGFQIKSHSLIFSGLCLECHRKSDTAQLVL